MDVVLSWLKVFGNFALAKLLPAAVILAVGLLAVRVVMKILKTALEKSKMDPGISKLSCAVARIVLYVLLSLMVASGLGIDVTGVVALASVLTLAVSLSVQTALTNVISGFTLLYTKPFVSGHYVEIAGQSGTVKEVGLTYTKLATGDNKIVSIPNSAVTEAEIVNYTVTGTRRVDVKVPVSYTTPVETVLEALMEASEGLPVLEGKKPFAAVHSYTDGGVLYVLQVWCCGEDYWPTLFAANQNVKRIFEEKGIQMTCLNVNVHMEK